MTQCRVVVVSGAIASGKTTVTRELARRAREQGSQVAAIDMDELVEMVMGNDWLTVTRTHLWLARQMAISLVEKLSNSGAELINGMQDHATVRFVTLEVPLAEALRRCQEDPQRVVTKDRGLVARIYNGIDWRVLPRGEIVLSTDGASVHETADRVEERLALR